MTRRAAINATLYDKLSFNFIRDIAPMSGIIRVPNVMEPKSCGPGRDGSGIRRVAKRRNAGRVNIASGGLRTNGGHMNGELFKMMTRIDMLHVPYRGGGAGTDRSYREDGPILFDPDAVFDEETPSIQQDARPCSDQSAMRSEALPELPDGGRFCARF